MLNFKLVNDPDKGKRIIVSFPAMGEDLSFDFNEVRKHGGKNHSSNDETHFRHVNEFLKGLPVERKMCFYSNLSFFSNALNAAGDDRWGRAQKALNYLPLMFIGFDEVLEYVRQNEESFHYPVHLKDYLTQDCVPDKTYTRVEYQGLIALSIYMRLVSPIVGEYFSAYTAEDGQIPSEAYRHIYQVLEQTSLGQTAEFKKLVSYIQAVDKTWRKESSEEERNHICRVAVARTLFFKLMNADLESTELSLATMAFQCAVVRLMSDCEQINKSFIEYFKNKVNKKESV